MFGVALGAVAFFALACGGGGSKDPAPTATTGAANPASTVAAGTTPASGSTQAASVTRASVANLNSYKYLIKMSGKGGPMGEITGGLDQTLSQSGLTAGPSLVFEVSGAYIKPDKAQTAIKFGTLTTSSTVIGNQQWSSFGGQTLGPLPATAADVANANFLNDFWTDDGIGASLKDFKCGSKESVNGVSAVKCSLDKAGFEKLSKNSGVLTGLEGSTYTTASIEVWIADAGYPVRMRMDVAGKDASKADFSFKVELDVTDINGNFQITAPKS